MLSCTLYDSIIVNLIAATATSKIELARNIYLVTF